MGGVLPEVPGTNLASFKAAGAVGPSMESKGGVQSPKSCPFLLVLFTAMCSSSLGRSPQTG